MLQEREARLLIDEVERRYAEDQRRIEMRRAHFHNLPSANPKLPAPYELAYAYQSDVPRQVHTKLKSRLTENHFLLRARGPQDEPDTNSRASRLEQVMNAGWAQIEKRNGYTIQGALADGLTIDKYGVLFWCKAEDLIPAVDPKRVGQRAWDMARAGYPWHAEVLDPMGFMPVEDRAMENGMGLVVVRREVGILDYQAARDEGVLALSQVSDIALGMERDAPAQDSPSGSAWNERILLYQIWDRNQWLEGTSKTHTGGSLTLINGGDHPYEMPPFAIAPAMQVNNPDPVLRYEPALTGVYRLKPLVDYYHSLFFANAEYAMLPYFYFEATDGGFPLADDSGNIMIFDRKSIGSARVPTGYTLKRLDFDVSATFANMGATIMEQYAAARPATGQAEFDRNTQPWAIRLQQAQESVEPGEYLDNIARTIEIASQNMAMVMSKDVKAGGFGEPVSVFARYDDGAVDRSRTISIDAPEIDGLDISVKTSNMSAAERITQIQVQRELLNDPKVPMTRYQFLVDAMGDPHPEQTIAASDAEELHDAYVKPAQGRQIVTKKFGHLVRIGPDGQAYGPDGQPIQPLQALIANGFKPVQPAGAPMAQGAEAQPSHPDLPSLATPNTIPQAGIKG